MLKITSFACLNPATTTILQPLTALWNLSDPGQIPESRRMVVVVVGRQDALPATNQQR